MQHLGAVAVDRAAEVVGVSPRGTAGQVGVSARVGAGQAERQGGGVGQAHALPVPGAGWQGRPGAWLGAAPDGGAQALGLAEAVGGAVRVQHAVRDGRGLRLTTEKTPPAQPPACGPTWGRDGGWGGRGLRGEEGRGGGEGEGGKGGVGTRGRCGRGGEARPGSWLRKKGVGPLQYRNTFAMFGGTTAHLLRGLFYCSSE